MPLMKSRAAILFRASGWTSSTRNAVCLTTLHDQFVLLRNDHFAVCNAGSH